MNVSFLSASLSRKGGGVTEVKRNLALSLLKTKDIKLEVFGLKDEETTNDLSAWYPLEPIAFQPIGPRALGYSPNLLTSAKNSNSDLIHLHGLWQYPSFVALRSKKPYITTIHGMLEPWALNNSRLKKNIAGILYEKNALIKANCLQAITANEYHDIRKFNLKNPVCIIPNGVDIPQNVTDLQKQTPIWDSTKVGKKKLLYLGRIHPKKGLTNLLKAWKKAKTQKVKGFADWDLVIAGWDQGGYEDQLKKLAEEMDIDRTVHFVGPQFNLQKQLAYAHADAFILPSFSEGLPMVVLEAWAFGLPVLITEQCNLPEGYSSGAAFHISPSEQSILEGLTKLFECSDHQLEQVGKQGKKLVQEKFSWENVAEQMNLVYQWIIEGGPKPNSIIIN